MLAVLHVLNFFKLKDTAKLDSSTQQQRRPQSKTNPVLIVNGFDENSDDDEPSVKRSSAHNGSHLSRLSAADDDNNNESNVTPTLNNSIPRITPEIKIINSTPLNHYNHQHEGLSSRKYRRDLTKSW